MGGIGQRIACLAKLSLLELFRRKDLYVALILATVVLVPISLYNVFGVKGIVQHLSSVSLLLIWLFSLVIGVAVGARQFPAELEGRTIYPLLAKPVRRWELLLGKFSGAFLASAAALLLFYLGFILINGVKQGVWFNAVTAQAMVLHLAFLLVVTALAILGSLLLTVPANITLCGLLAVTMLLYGGNLAGYAQTAPFPGNAVAWLANLLGPHLDFFDLRRRLIHGYGPVSAATFTAVLAYALAYTAVLLGGAAWVLNRQKI